MRAAANSSAWARGAEAGGEAGENRLTQRLRARRAARLPRADDFEPKRGEARLEPPGLDRLAHALPALERDEPAPRAAGSSGAPDARRLPLQCSSNHAEETERPSFAQASASSAANDRSSQHGSAPLGNARKWDRIAGAPGSKPQSLGPLSALSGSSSRTRFSTRLIPASSWGCGRSSPRPAARAERAPAFQSRIRCGYASRIGIPHGNSCCLSTSERSVTLQRVNTRAPLQRVNTRVTLQRVNTRVTL